MIGRGLAAAGTFVLALSAGSPAAVADEDMAGLVARLSADVERLRGRKFLRPVQVRRVGDADARAHFRVRTLETWPEEKLVADSAAYQALGLLPTGQDLLASLLDLLEEQATGYYDPKTSTFFVLDDAPPESLPAVVVHELTHALDDQHFGLDAALERLREDDDAASAYAAVVEGSGSLVMSAWLLAELKSGRMELQAMSMLVSAEAARGASLRAAPALVQRSLLGPYVLGQLFLQRGDGLALARGLVAADIDQAFAQPPRSTEQILHPEKYWTRGEEPRAIELGDLSPLLGGGARRRAQGRLGELLVALLTRGPALDPLSPAAADARRWTTPAATGWAGDQYQLYDTPDGPVTLLALRWDTEDDALEFRAALSVPPTCAPFRSGPAVVLVCGATPTAAALVAPALGRALAAP